MGRGTHCSFSLPCTVMVGYAMGNVLELRLRSFIHYPPHGEGPSVPSFPCLQGNREQMLRARDCRNAIPNSITEILSSFFVVGLEAGMHFCLAASVRIGPGQILTTKRNVAVSHPPCTHCTLRVLRMAYGSTGQGCPVPNLLYSIRWLRVCELSSSCAVLAQILYCFLLFFLVSLASVRGDDEIFHLPWKHL